MAEINDRKNKVRCTVCGAVFDEGTERCPLCGVGKEYFVSATVGSASSAGVRTNEGRYVIIGGGIAGLSAAVEIRRILPGASIVIVERELSLPYLRPSLSKEVPANDVGGRFTLYPPEWYSRKGIFLYSGREAVRVDAGRKCVVLSSGEELVYDKCIFATGAASRVPPIPGRERAGVFTLRTVEDFRQIAHDIAHLTQRVPAGKGLGAVVVGGGILGLESATQLQLCGFDVTVLEAGDRLLGPRTDPVRAGEAYHQASAAGLHVHLGVRIAGFEGEGDRVEQVRFREDERTVVIGTDLVLICCGNAPNIRLAKEAGLDTGRAILVNSRMMTSKYGIYACGDCAQLGAEVCGLWTTAEAMGRCAGRNAAGEDEIYTPEASPRLYTAVAKS